MTDTSGLVVQGGDEADNLTARIETDQNGDRSIYNVLQGGGGDDHLNARSEDFTLNGATFGAQLFGEDGNDIIFDSWGRDTLSGGSGDDNISWAGGSDVIDGGEGFDILNIYAGRFSDLSVTGIEELDVVLNVAATDVELSQFHIIHSDARDRPAGVGPAVIWFT